MKICKFCAHYHNIKGNKNGSGFGCTGAPVACAMYKCNALRPEDAVEVANR